MAGLRPGSKGIAAKGHPKAEHWPSILWVGNAACDPAERGLEQKRGGLRGECCRRFLLSGASPPKVDRATVEGKRTKFNWMAPRLPIGLLRLKMMLEKLEPSAKVPERVLLTALTKSAPTVEPLRVKLVPLRGSLPPPVISQLLPGDRSAPSRPLGVGTPR